MRVDETTKICLVPRLAISDLIALCGLVHTLAAKCREVMVVAHRKHVHEVRALYEDAHVRFTFIKGWDELYGTHDVLAAARRSGYEVVPLASVGDCCPYRLLGIDPVEYGIGFRLTRRLDAEQALHDRIVAAVGSKYVIVHDDETRRIRNQLLPPGVPVVRVRDPEWRTASVFDWIRTMDHAHELHAVHSCFALLADVLSLRVPSVLHAYASPCGARARYPGARVIY